MTWWHALIVLVAGIWAGTINTVVGSGTLVTFPVLVALGYPPVTATTSNAIGLTPGSITGVIGYRRELRGQWKRAGRLAIATTIGAIGGTALLLGLPPGAFELVVPWLIGAALVLIVMQPRISAWVQSTQGEDAGREGVLLYMAVFAIGVYGGYFTAAQGIMLMSALGILLHEPMQRLNGLKNVLAGVATLVAGIVYAFVAPVDWAVVAILAVGSVLGGVIGSSVGRKLPPRVLRAVIVVVGVAAIVNFVLR